MSTIGDKALEILPPINNNAANDEGFRIAGLGTAGNAAIPKSWLGRTMTLKSIGVGTDYAISEGTAAPTLVFGQAAAIGTGSAARGTNIPSGGSERVFIPPTAKFIAWITASAAGQFEGCVSSRGGYK